MSFDYTAYYTGMAEVKALQAGIGIVPCDLPWCVYPAEWEWIRTAAELKAMRCRVKGSVVDAAPVIQVCEKHRRGGRPFVPLGSTGIVAVPVTAKRARAPKACPHCGGAL